MSELLVAPRVDRLGEVGGHGSWFPLRRCGAAFPVSATGEPTLSARLYLQADVSACGAVSSLVSPAVAAAKAPPLSMTINSMELSDQQAPGAVMLSTSIRAKKGRESTMRKLLEALVKETEVSHGGAVFTSTVNQVRVGCVPRSCGGTPETSTLAACSCSRSELCSVSCFESSSGAAAREGWPSQCM